VVNIGHCNSAIVSAIREQTTRFLHAGFNVTPYESYIRLCQRLNQSFARLHPAPVEAKSFLANSGAEAVENAVKIARAFTGRQAVICFDHGFHGRTYMAMTLTSKYKPYKYGFAPFNPEVYRAPFPYLYRWPGSSDPEVVSEECFEEFRKLAQYQLSPTQIAAVIFEPVLGEGGFVPMPPQFLQKLSKFCAEHGIVLIADEIQSGFGRTGTLYASEQLGVAPDLLITAKSLGAGLPISAVTGRAPIMDAPIEGAIGGTFGGNPLACAAALAVFDWIKQTDALKKSAELGAYLQKRLHDWRTQCVVIGDVRGLGPMQGIEFVRFQKTKEPNPDAAKALVRFAYENGVICMTSGTYSNVVRLLMPLTIKDDELEEGLAVLEKGLATIQKAG
jgi:4-aminobutyrate aminotransferase/(S)-3-amino-2-methylpropionate transaminase